MGSVHLRTPSVWVWLFFLLIVPGAVLCAQSTSRGVPRVGIVAAYNSTGAEQYNAVGQVIYDTTVLTLRLIGAYDVVELSSVGEVLSETELLAVATEHNLANIVLAEIRFDQAELALEMSVFDTLQERIALTRRQDPPGLLAVFEATETLVAELVEAFSGVPVGFGSLVLRNVGEPGSYHLYLDDEALGRDIKRVERILMGERRVEVRQQRMMGEYIVYAQTVLIAPGEQHEIEFSIPYLIEAERLVLDDFERQIRSEIERPQNEYRIEELLLSAEAALTAISYSTGLSVERRRFAELREAWQDEIEAWTLRLRPRWVFPFRVGYAFALFGEDQEPAGVSWEGDYPQSGPLSVFGLLRRFGTRLYLGTEFFMLPLTSQLPTPLIATAWQPHRSTLSYHMSGIVLPPNENGSVAMLVAGVRHRNYEFQLLISRQNTSGNLLIGPLIGLNF